jgi:CheY-like chemotaxis protein
MAGNAHHVLVIEDDAETAEQLVDCVRTNGYAVDLSMDGEDAAKRSRSASPGLLAYLGCRDGCGYFHLAALGRAGRSDQCDGEVIADLDEILRNFSSLLRITLIETRDRMAAFRKNWIFRELVPALRKSRRRASEPTAYWFRKPNPICPASGNPPLATIADGRRRHV